MTMSTTFKTNTQGEPRVLAAITENFRKPSFNVIDIQPPFFQTVIVRRSVYASRTKKSRVLSHSQPQLILSGGLLLNGNKSAGTHRAGRDVEKERCGDAEKE